jgi:hypothetical protein
MVRWLAFWVTFKFGRIRGGWPATIRQTNSLLITMRALECGSVGSLFEATQRVVDESNATGRNRFQSKFDRRFGLTKSRQRPIL